jgi:TolB-like protein
VQSTGQPDIAFGPFLLQQNERRLTNDGTPVSIGGRAFDILTALAVAGETVRKDVIMDQVWPGRAVEENNLQVHISALRKALGAEWIITVPNRGYRLRLEAKAADPGRDIGYRPSIVVFPFVSLGDDIGQQRFADGLAEEIATALSRFRWLSVVGRSAVRTLKGREIDVRRVGRDLGARYALEGSVRGPGPSVRVSGRLVETATGRDLWAGRFDGDLLDVLASQDRFTASVVAAVGPGLFNAEIKRARDETILGAGGYDLMLRAVAFCHLRTRDGLAEAERLLHRALEAEPAYAPAMAALATRHWIAVSQGWNDRSDPSVTRMVDLAKTALALDSEDSILLHIAAEITALPGGDLDGGLALINRSLALNQNDTFALAKASRLHTYAGDTGRAFSLLDRCVPLGSLSGSSGACFARGLAHFADGDHTASAEWMKNELWESPNHAPALRYRAASLGLLGRIAEGEDALRWLLALVPGFTISRMRRHIEFDMNNVFRTPDVATSLYEGLRRCGLS